MSSTKIRPFAFALAVALALPPLAQAATLAVSVLDKEGKPTPDAIVVLVPQVAALPARPLPSSAAITQEKMQFVPAVTLVRTGAKVTFTNNDTWDHHVRGTAAGLQQFTTGQGGGFELRLEGRAEGKPARAAEVVLDKAGAVLLGCHIHGSMRGHVYVSDSPWAAKTNADGIAQFDDLPPGAVLVRVWHADQLVDLPPQSVQVGATPQKAEARLQVVPRRRRI